MCYFITISIPGSGIEIAKEKLPRNLHLSPSENPIIQRLVPKEFQHFYVTSGGCSCDLFYKASNEDSKEDIVEKLRRKFKKKGWPENKIKRAIKQSISQRKNSRATGLSDDLKFFISEILSKVKEVRLFVHWYGGITDQEKVELKHGPTISSYQLRTQNVVTDTDIIYKIEGR